MLVGQASFDEGGNSLSPPLSHPGVGVLADLQQVTSLGRAHTHKHCRRRGKESGEKAGERERKERERKRAISIERARDLSQGQFKQYAHPFLTAGG